MIVHKLIKILLFPIAFVLGIIFCWIVIPYIVCPIYDFKQTEKFAGQNFYNPYQNLDTTWQIANFHSHTAAWLGITDGEKNSKQQFVNTYKGLGYNHIGISNYQKTNNYIAFDSNCISIPTYEHGINVKKRHHLVIGADRVIWTDFFFWQTLNHKQFIINRFQGSCDFLTINHPQFCKGFLPKDFLYLSNYDAVEVFNHYRISIEQWDSALSSGYYAVLLANDDMHDLEKMDEVSSNFTVINTSQLTQRNLIQALKAGKHFGVRVHFKSNENLAVKKERIQQLVYPKIIDIQNDTLSVVLSKSVNTINIIGQGGMLKQSYQKVDRANYLIDSLDTYLRIEIFDEDSNRILLNPIVRCEKQVPVNMLRCEVNILKTTIKYILEALVVIFLILILFRNWWKTQYLNFTQWIVKPYRKWLLLVIGFSLLLRFILALSMELNNDELYYRLFTWFPSWSYFDHPPMVGWLIGLTSWNFLWNSELAIRFSALILCVANSFLIFNLTKKLSDERLAFFTTLLFNLSPYVLIVCGTFILPDAGLLFFWLLALNYIVQIFILQKNNWAFYIGLGLSIGMACLAKYTAIVLWIGIGIYLLLYGKAFFKEKKLYVAIFITVICCLPILYWNIVHNFISFTYQGGRLVVNGELHLENLALELFGEWLYNNPILFIFTILTTIIYIKKGNLKFGKQNKYQLFYCISIPLIIIFWFFSCFNFMLPHWSSPAYITLLIPTSAIMLQRMDKQQWHILMWIKIAIVLIIIVFILFFTQKYFSFPMPANQYVKDYTIEISTCEQSAKLFMDYAREQEQCGAMPIDAPILAPTWSMAAQYEYYISEKEGRRILTLGPLYCTHQYAWISQKRNGLEYGMDLWFITDSYDYRSPYFISTCFQEIEGADTLQVYCNKRHVKDLYVYKMRGLQRIPKYIY